MTAIQILNHIIRPTLRQAAHRQRARLDGASAEALLLGVAGQESGLEHLVQLGAGGRAVGPAHSLWQIEPIAVEDTVVPRHRPQLAWVRSELQMIGAPLVVGELHDLIARADCQDWACLIARGRLWLVPHRLPEPVHDMTELDFLARAATNFGRSTPYDPAWPDTLKAWWQYLEAWRPGKPKPKTWCHWWGLACETVKG